MMDGVNEYAIEDYEEAYSYTYEDLRDDAVYNKLTGGNRCGKLSRLLCASNLYRK